MDNRILENAQAKWIYLVLPLPYSKSQKQQSHTFCGGH